MIKVKITQDQASGPIFASVFAKDGDGENIPADLEIEVTLPPETLAIAMKQIKDLATAGCVMGSLGFWENLLRNR